MKIMGTRVKKFVTQIIDENYDIDLFATQHIWRCIKVVEDVSDRLCVCIGNETVHQNKNLKWFLDRYKRAFLIHFDEEIIDYKKVFPFPLGNSFGKSNFELPGYIISPLQRKYKYSYVGSMSSHKDRYDILNHSSKPEYFIVPKYQWTFNNTNKEKDDYLISLTDAQYALCPSGKNAETFRIYDALDCGAVPVLKRDFYTEKIIEMFKFYLDKECPIVLIDDWNNIDLPNVTNEQQTKLIEWYHNFKRKLRFFAIDSISS